MRSIKELCEAIGSAHFPRVNCIHPDWKEEKARADASLEAAKAAVEELRRHPEKEQAIGMLRGGDGDRIDFAGEALAAIGSDEALLALLDLFKKNDRSGNLAKVMVESGGTRLKPLLSSGDFEAIVLSAFDYSLDEKYACLLGDISSDQAIDKLIYMLFQTQRIQAYRDKAILELVRVGGKTNRKLLDKLKREWVVEQKDQQTQYRKDILRVLKATGDEDSIPEIREIMVADGRVSQAAADAIVSISRRLGLTMEVISFAGSVEEALRKAKSGLDKSAEIIDIEKTEAGERSIVVEAYSEREAAEKAERLLLDRESLEEIVAQEAGTKGIFGIGKKPAQYAARIAKDARVRILYKYKK